MTYRLFAPLGLFACLSWAALSVPSRGLAGQCARFDGEPTARLLAVPDVVASDGGLLVAAALELGDGPSDPAFHLAPAGRLALRSGHFLVAGREVSAHLEQLANGLARLLPNEPLMGPAVWVGGGAPVPVRFEARANTLTSAPAVNSASLRVRRSRATGEDTDVTYQLSATLRRDAPAEARVLLLYEGDAEHAVAFRELGVPSGRRIEVASGGSCVPGGWPFAWPTPRARVRAAYVDDSGRLSPKSRPLRLR